LFLLHPIGGGLPIMHLTDTVYHASVEKNPFCKRRFPRINMRTDPYVASTLQQEFTFWGIWIIRHFNFLKNYQRK
jgi:hypothetical protein